MYKSVIFFKRLCFETIILEMTAMKIDYITVLGKPSQNSSLEEAGWIYQVLRVNTYLSDAPQVGQFGYVLMSFFGICQHRLHLRRYFLYLKD